MGMELHKILDITEKKEYLLLYLIKRVKKLIQIINGAESKRPRF